MHGVVATPKGTTYSTMDMTIQILITQRAAPVAVDTTGDGIANAMGVMVDSNGDGIPDRFAVVVDTVGDGQADSLGVDTTGDGIVDQIICQWKNVNVMVTSTNVDTTGDGKPNLVLTCDVVGDAARPPAQAHYCAYCGNLLGAAVKFCDRCGNECLEVNPTSEMEMKEEQSTFNAQALTLKHIVDAIEEWGKSNLSHQHSVSAEDCDISVEEVSIGAHAWKAGTYGQATAPLAVVAVDGHAPPAYEEAVPEMGNWSLPTGLNMPLSMLLQANNMQLTFKADTTVETYVPPPQVECCVLL